MSLVVEQPLSTKLHAEDKETEELCQTSAEDIESEIHLKPVSEVGDGVLQKRAMFVHAVDTTIQFPHGGMINRTTSQQTEELHGLDG